MTVARTDLPLSSKSTLKISPLIIFPLSILTHVFRGSRPPKSQARAFDVPPGSTQIGIFIKVLKK
jgi:hypothetical protein